MVEITTKTNNEWCCWLWPCIDSLCLPHPWASHPSALTPLRTEGISSLPRSLMTTGKLEWNQNLISCHWHSIEHTYCVDKIFFSFKVLFLFDRSLVWHLQNLEGNKSAFKALLTCNVVLLKFLSYLLEFSKIICQNFKINFKNCLIYGKIRK